MCAWTEPPLVGRHWLGALCLKEGVVASAKRAQLPVGAAIGVSGRAAICTFGPMRLLILLWAMYVLVLSGVPCDRLCQVESTTTAGQGTAPHSGEQDDCKSCSPFSVCAACPGFMLPAPVWAGHLASVVPALASARLPVYRAPYALEVAARIWQPPRLG